MFFSYFAWGIDDFGVSNAILLRGANSGQTFIKCCDQAYNVEPWLFLKNCKDLTMKLEVKYISPTSCSGRNFYIDQLPEGTGMRRILAQGIRIQKNPQSRQNIFWIFKDYHGITGVQSPTCTPRLKFHQWG